MSEVRMVHGDDQQVVRDLTVGDLMRRPVVEVERHAHLAAATYLFKKAGDNAVVVVNEPVEMLPLAVITEADVAQVVADGRDPNDVRISELVSAVPMTVPREMGVAAAAELMLSSRLDHLAVVDGTRLVGIVDLSDICRGLLATPARNG